MQSDSYRIASELDQPPVVTDTEFFAFVVGEQRNLGFWRRAAVSRILRREPWSSMLRREQAEVAQSAFMNRDPQTTRQEFCELWEEHIFEASKPDRKPLESEQVDDRSRITKPHPAWRIGFAATAVAAVVCVGILVSNSLRSPFPTDIVALAELSQKHLDNADVWFAPRRDTGHGLDLLDPVDKVVTTLRPTLRWRAVEPGLRIVKVSVYEGDSSAGTAIQSRENPSEGSWRPESDLKPLTLYTWRVDYELGDLKMNAVAKFATPSQEALALSQGDVDDLTIVQRCALLVELQSYDEALALLKQALNDQSLTREERASLEALADRLRNETSGGY